MESRRLHPVLWGVLLGLILAAWQFPFARLIDDDFIQVGIIEGTVDCCGTAPFGLYGFCSGEPEDIERLIKEGPLPWFTHPRLTIDFFRPLSSLLVVADHSLFGRWAPGYRFQTTLWYLALVATFGFLVSLFLSSDKSPRARWVMVLAPLLLAASTSHWQSLAYTAARWVLIATAFGVAGLFAYVGWRARGWQAGRWISLSCFVLSLLAGEAGIAVLAYVLAYELVAAPGLPGSRLRAIMPVALLAAGYLVFYKASGFGSAGGDGYLDPLGAPMQFFIDAPGRYLAMAGEVLLGVHARYWFFPSIAYAGPITYRILSVGAGASGVLLLSLLLWPTTKNASVQIRRLAGWMALGTAGSMIPLASSPPGSRHLVIPAIGAATLVAIVLSGAGDIVRNLLSGDGSEPDRKRSVILGGAVLPGCIILVVVHLALAPYRWLSGPQDLASYRESFEQVVRQTPFVDPDVPGQRTVFLTPLKQVVLQGFFLRKSEGLPMPDRWWALTTAPFTHRYHRTGPDELELEIVDGRMAGSFEERGIRSASLPLQEGDVFDLYGLVITVLKTDSLGATRIRYKFDVPLEDATLRFIAAPRGLPVPVRPPGPGQTLEIPNPM